jgi:fucose permease
LLFLLGLGAGAYVTTVNSAVIDRFSARTTSALALVHAAATFGACVGPLFVQLLRKQAHWSVAFQALGLMHGVIGVSGLFTRLQANTATAPKSRPRAAGRLRSPALIALAVIAFAYVGTENGITLFAVPWALERADPVSVGQWSISTFWFGLLLGRLTLALRSPARGLQLVAACGLAGGVVLCATSALSLGPLIAATALAGLSLGPVYPMLVTLAAQRFPASPGTAVGLATGAGAVGGSFVPWLIGVFGDSLGLRTAMTLLGAHAWIVAAAALALLHYESVRKRSLPA